MGEQKLRLRLEVTFYITQALSGHGCFTSYLHRFGKADYLACVFCEYGDDNAEHTLFYCDAWHIARRSVGILVGSDLDSSNMVDLMMESKNN